jgi:hypothetical protein
MKTLLMYPFSSILCVFKENEKRGNRIFVWNQTSKEKKKVKKRKREVKRTGRGRSREKK